MIVTDKSVKMDLFVEGSNAGINIVVNWLTNILVLSCGAFTYIAVMSFPGDLPQELLLPSKNAAYFWLGFNTIAGLFMSLVTETGSQSISLIGRIIQNRKTKRDIRHAQNAILVRDRSST